jgi:hypothetical protein
MIPNSESNIVFKLNEGAFDYLTTWSADSMYVSCRWVRICVEGGGRTLIQQASALVIFIYSSCNFDGALSAFSALLEQDFLCPEKKSRHIIPSDVSSAYLVR